MYQFPVHVSESKKTKKEIIKFLLEKYQTKHLTINLIDSEFITQTTGKWLKGDVYFGFNLSLIHI